MPDLLPSYTFSKSAGRYRSSATGQFVSRRAIIGLMESHVNGAAARYAELTTAFYEGNMSAAAWIEQMRTEQRRLTLQNSAIGSGGWDGMFQKDFGRVGSSLRQDYARIVGLAADIQEGKATLPQALARVNSYAGNARAQYYLAERDRVQRTDSSMIIIERRILGSGGQSCKDCIELYGRGWQLFGSLPAPCTDTICGGNCKCRLLRKEVPAVDVGDWIGSKKS